ERANSTDVVGPLAALERIVSPLPVADERVMELVHAVAQRWAGTVPDVLRLAVPPRHAAGERSALTALARMQDEPPPQPDPQDFPAPEGAPPALAGYVEALTDWLGPDADSAGLGRQTPEDDRAAGHPGPRAAAALTPAGEPGTGWITAGLHAAAHVIAAGRSVLWVVPDHRELDALAARLGSLSAHTVRLSADQGPQARWSAWVRAHAGGARLVIGTRAAALAPLSDLG